MAKTRTWGWLFAVAFIVSGWILRTQCDAGGIFIDLQCLFQWRNLLGAHLFYSGVALLTAFIGESLPEKPGKFIYWFGILMLIAAQIVFVAAWLAYASTLI